jgi:predicted ribosome quality control (RQC) complex YloA/Tae2 family protein
MKYLVNFLESKSNKPNVKRHDIDGFVVFQGRDAESNDHLTFEVAKDQDYWFHAKGVPGSHIILVIKDKLPTEITLKKCAQLAAKNSKSKDEDVPVVYCKKQFVRKTPELKSGQVKVDYVNSNEIVVSKS